MGKNERDVHYQDYCEHIFSKNYIIKKILCIYICI